MKYLRNTVVLILAGLILSGCVSQSSSAIPKPDFEDMAAVDSDLRRNPSGYSIRIYNVTGGQETDIWKGSRINGQSFLKALALSIDHNNYFMLVGPEEPSDYILAARIINQKQPSMGLDMTVSLTVDYGLFDKAENTIWQKSISNDYTVKYSEAFIGAVRLDLANEGVVRENIRKALKQIYSIPL